jgi:hypothetical protein
MSWFWGSSEEKTKKDEVKITVPKREELAKLNLDTGLVLPKKPGFDRKIKKTNIFMDAPPAGENSLDGK